MTELIPADVPVIGLGRMLCEAREAKGLSQAEVAEQLYLSKQRIIEVESDDYSTIAPVFAKGYLKAYARLLNLKADEVLAKFGELGVEQNQESYKYNSVITRAHKSRHKRRYLVWILSMVLVVVLFLLVLMWINGGSDLNTNLQQVGHIMKQVAVP